MADSIHKAGITVSPGDAKSHEILNLSSLGIALVITWLAMILWSPVVVPTAFSSIDDDIQVHFMRLSTLVVIALVYLLASVISSTVRRRRFRGVFVAVGTLVSPFAVLGNVVPAFGDLCAAYPALYLMSWIFAGLSASLLMLIWGYDSPSKPTYRQGVVNIAGASMFSGAFFMFCSILDQYVACILVIILPFVMAVIWIIDFVRDRRERSDEPVSSADSHQSVTQVRMALGDNAFAFVMSYGFIAGMAGSIATTFALSENAVYIVGLSTLVSGVITFAVLRNTSFGATRTIFLVFLPFAVACLFLLSLVGGTAKLIMLFAIFFATTAYNIENTAFPRSGGPAVQGSAIELLRSESRIADMLGAALGWAAATAIEFYAPPELMPYCYFLIAAILVGVLTVLPLRRNGRVRENEDAYQDQMQEQLPAQLSVFQIWEDECARLSDAYGFSAREREVFLLLSRGRDRQYIHNALNISPSTVRTHTYNIYRKMGVHDQQALIDVVENTLRNCDQGAS